MYEYLISVELNISDVTQIDRLRTIQTNSYPISIDKQIQIFDVNIYKGKNSFKINHCALTIISNYINSLTLLCLSSGLIMILFVCLPSGTRYLCRCEEQFRLPCHMCATSGKCNDIVDNSCECINADGLYCQPLAVRRWKYALNTFNASVYCFQTDLEYICPSPTPANGMKYQCIFQIYINS